MELPSHFIKIQGTDSGPAVIVLGGTHGDERIGIEVVNRLAVIFGARMEQNGQVVNSNEIAGALYLGYGNPEAVKLNRRGVSEKDLNRCFGPEELVNFEKYNSDDYSRGRELAPLFEQTDFLFDLHATSSSSVPFVCFGRTNADIQRFYKLIPVKYILTDSAEPPVLGTPYNLKNLGTTDYYVNTFGGGEWSVKKYGRKQGLALCYETGQCNDLSKVESVLHTIGLLLVEAGIINKDFLEKQNFSVEYSVPEQEVYRLAYCGLAEETVFSYAPEMLKNWILVNKGELLGHYQSGKEVRVPQSGMLVFTKQPDKIRFSGDSLYYIAERI